MSYEGYTEWRCKCGAIEAADVYAAQPLACRACGERWTSCRSVDQTNGHEVLEWRDVKFRPQFNDYVSASLGDQP